MQGEKQNGNDSPMSTEWVLGVLGQGCWLKRLVEGKAGLS